MYLRRLEQGIWKEKRERMDEANTTRPLLVNNIYSVMKEKNTQGITERESSISYNTKKHNNNKEPYMDRSKSTERKVSFAAVFRDITSREALLEEASIHTAEMTAIKIPMREIQKKEDIRWVMDTVSLSSILAIENN